ncbi:MAG TPA: hypothetical protein VED01_20215 [Burkholderiales bacterium]|nr:hypothetical protein [Burkholderiales bacterium]
MYYPHPDPRLQQLFKAKPFQGAEPGSAQFLFFGLDANFDPAIGTKPYFGEIESYLENGPRYWRERGFHHPFLHPEYRGHGASYHRRFAGIGFRPEHAEQVAFVELIELATYGTSRLRRSDLSPTHLQRLARWVLEGNASVVFMPPNVVSLLCKTDEFGWLKADPDDLEGPLKVVFRSSAKLIVSPFHFSYYGRGYTKPEREAQIAAIRRLTIDAGTPSDRRP